MVFYIENLIIGLNFCNACVFRPLPCTYPYSLSHITFAGIQAGPQSLDVLEDALGVLLILTNGNYTVVESMARRRAAHKVLLELAATAPHQHICVNSLNVIANMAHCR